MSYFVRTGTRSFRPTEHCSGAWNTEEIHIAPVFGLLAHELELNRIARGRDGMRIARISFDILGVLPLEEYRTAVTVVRPGKSVELVEAVLSHADRPAVRARAWLLDVEDTAAIAGTPEPALPAPDELEPWDPTTVWAGGMLASIQVRRESVEPGHARYWLRTDHALLDGEEVSPLARAVGVLDIANGMAVRAAPEAVAYPNLDLTVHLHRDPQPGWLGFDTRVTFGAPLHAGPDEDMRALRTGIETCMMKLDDLRMRLAAPEQT